MIDGQFIFGASLMTLDNAVDVGLELCRIGFL
jgi:hypothetical protein